MKIYDTAALYGQNMSDEQQSKLMDFYHDLLEEYDIATIHDCTIGAGGTTIPLAKLGYKVSGSDISENLLERTKINFNESGYEIELFNSDLRNLDTVLREPVDCIISTGNSLPHVTNEGVRDFVKNATKCLNPRGLLFIDIRNWDQLLDEKPLIKTRDPIVMTAEEHIGLHQIFVWHDDQSVEFAFATIKDENGKHKETKMLFAPMYYPLKRSTYERILMDHGYDLINYYDLDSIWIHPSQQRPKSGSFEADFHQIAWYGILAQKK
jgi:2-polyprenyl-3-methyl-5-hydroxy-6-metoxy-1,4-benzoquinol methylase